MAVIEHIAARRRHLSRCLTAVNRGLMAASQQALPTAHKVNIHLVRGLAVGR